MKTIVIALAAMLILIFSGSIKSYAQVDIRGKLKSKSLDRANQSADEGIDNGMNAAEDGVKKSTEKNDNNKDDNKKDADNEKKDNDNPQQSSTNSTQTSSGQQSLSSYSKFDFIPGEKVIFYDDFSQDVLADFPGMWNTTGSGEVTTTNLYPGNWFKMKPGGIFLPEVDIPFNENFTFECDLIFKDVPTSNSSEGLDINFIAASPEWKIGDEITNGCWISLSGSDAGAQS
jgi:OmpA-OmpF porin, OOP family